MAASRPLYFRYSSRPNLRISMIRFSALILIISSLFFSSFYFFIPLGPPASPFAPTPKPKFRGDLRDARFPWNELCFEPAAGSVKLRLAVFSKAWPVGSTPGGMERHAATLYRALADRGHEVHVFTAPLDRLPHEDIHGGNLHVYFAVNDHGSLNCSLAFDLFLAINENQLFDYVHTESVSLPHWRAKNVPRLAVTWHGIWYEIMHSKLFQELVSNSDVTDPTELHEAMPKLVDEIRFFRSYNHHICISNSAGEALVNIYQLPPRNVHVILNGVDDTKFIQDPKSGNMFRRKHGIPENARLVMGVAGRLVRDKGHPLLYEAFSLISKTNTTGVYLLVAGEGPWGRRYLQLGQNVKVLGALEASELSEFYNAIDVFVNPTLRPQGLDLTLMEAMHCGKPVIAPNYASIVGTVVVNESLGYTFAPNVESLVDALEAAIRDGPKVLQNKGRVCKAYASSMFTSSRMASAYERFFLCMRDSKYCQYPLHTDC